MKQIKFKLWIGFLVLVLAVGSFVVHNRKHSLKSLVVEDLVVGTGTEATKGKVVVINYVGKLRDTNKQFDSSYDRSTPYTLDVGVGHALPAWDQGILGMKVGGKRKLTVPSELAYGEKGAGSVVPPNSELVYEIELMEVKDSLTPKVKESLPPKVKGKTKKK